MQMCEPIGRGVQLIAGMAPAHSAYACTHKSRNAIERPCYAAHSKAVWSQPNPMHAMATWQGTRQPTSNLMGGK